MLRIINFDNVGLICWGNINFYYPERSARMSLLLYALKELEIDSVGSRPNTRYGIMMDKAKIEFVY